MNHQATANSIEQWFKIHRRKLPWRSRRSAWRSLVSEFMLQQTQVSRVLEKFTPFMERFPTPAALARADEQEVLAMWQGLGYYRRARNLKRAAEAIVDQFGGRSPLDVEALMSLPGIGRYTAGAIASIAGKRRVPIVDGNVQRVLARLCEDDAEQSSKEAIDRAWQRATQLVEACDKPELLNEGMMELGALVCTPGTPSCGRCPLASRCASRRSGRQNSIPPPKKTPPRVEVHHHALVIRNRGRLLVEQRGEEGIWAGLWQVPTIESKRKLAPSQVRQRSGLALRKLRRAGSFTHVLSHRQIHVHVFEGDLASGRKTDVSRGQWHAGSKLDQLPASNAFRRVIELA